MVQFERWLRTETNHWYENFNDSRFSSQSELSSQPSYKLRFATFFRPALKVMKSHVWLLLKLNEMKLEFNCKKVALSEYCKIERFSIDREKVGWTSLGCDYSSQVIWFVFSFRCWCHSCGAQRSLQASSREMRYQTNQSGEMEYQHGRVTGKTWYQLGQCFQVLRLPW